MSLKEYLYQHRKIVFVALLLLFLSLQPVQVEEQKELFPAVAVPWVIGGSIVAAFPMIFTLYRSTFFSPSIPMYVWLIGFAVIFMMLRRR